MKIAFAVIVAAVLSCTSGFSQESKDQTRREQGRPSIAALTEEERQWLRDHPVIRVAQDPGWPPVEFADDQGEPSGISSDYLNLIEERLGVKFERIVNLSWQESYARLKRWDIDMTTCVTVTPERIEFWAFTKPYMQIPVVILTHSDVTYISSIRELAGKTVAVVDGYVASERIPRDFPDVQLVRVRTVREGLDLLERRGVFAFVDNMLVTGYFMAKLKLFNLKIAGETPFVNAQAMAVRKDWAILAGILQKALDTISEKEGAVIYQKWVPIRYEHGFDYKLLWYALAIFAVILSGAFVWNQKLSKEIKSRKEAEAASRESEERFRAIASNTPDHILMQDRLLRYTFVVNPQLGLMEQDMIGRTDYDFLSKEEADQLTRTKTRVLESGRPVHFETSLISKTGGAEFFDGSYIPKFDSNGKVDGLIGYFRNVTKRQNMDEALRINEEKFRRIFENVLDVYYETSFDGTIVEISPSIEIVSKGQYRRNEFIGRSMFDFFADAGERQAFLSALQERGNVADFEFSLKNRDGSSVACSISSKVWFNAQGHPKSIIGSLRDIGERKRAEAERERLMAGIEQVGEVVMITDRDGAIQYVNPAFERVTGYSRREALGRNPRFLQSGKQDQAFYRELWRTISSGKTWQGVVVNKCLDGKLYTEEATISPVCDIAGRIVSYVAVKRDISAQRQIEEQLRQAQKMETVGQLAGGVAHDFNNMLQVIISYVDMSLEKVKAGQPLHQYLLEIRRAAQRSAEITGQLLAFARKQTVSPKLLDLNEAVANTQKMIQRLIGEDIDLAWLPGHELWKVKIDPAQLDQILANLAVNARDAIDGVGKLIVGTKNVGFDQAYCDTHAGFIPGEYLQLAVSDDGRGMDKETLSHLFEPFFTTKGPGKGTGLGLATVYGIVKQNNGFINVYSEPGQGTTFKVYLPRAEGAEAAERVEAEAAAPRGGTETVLVVEDEAAILELARESLELLGYSILTANAPEEALRLSGEQAGPIHLLITDVVMPQMNGRQLAERLRAARPGLKCLFMSGYTADVIAHRGVLDEGLSFIAKPFSIAVLAEKIRKALDGG